eukprot:GHVU01073410.1.p1 GENE.GHVU01073410.1~~GHVU01073410.1.p1  ORF type:complete len:118 (-),score=12.99 GHVU01073410.1:144-497(-)
MLIASYKDADKDNPSFQDTDGNDQSLLTQHLISRGKRYEAKAKGSYLISIEAVLNAINFHKKYAEDPSIVQEASKISLPRTAIGKKIDRVYEAEPEIHEGIQDPKGMGAGCDKQHRD